MKNIWFLRPHGKIGISIFNSLSKKYNVSLLTTNNKNIGSFKKKHKENIFFINEELLNLSCKKTFDLKKGELPKGLAYETLYKAIQVLERNERFNGELNFEERNYIVHKQYNFWKSEVEKKKLSCAIFFDIPHMYYEVVLLAVLKEKKIPIVILNLDYSFSLFLNGDFQPINLGKGVRFNEISNSYLDKISKNKKINHDVQLNKQNSYLKDVLHLIFQILKIPYKFLLKKKDVNSKYIKNGYFKFGESSTLNENITDICNSYKLILNKIYYNYVSLKKNDLKEKKYIYFPLISHFENILHPLASPRTLLMLLESLLPKLPKNIKIFVKEHPRQFTFRSHQKYARNIEFYKKIKNLKNVELISMKNNHKELIKHSAYVFCSSSSTSALESIFDSKKFIYYGYKIFEKKYGHYLDDVININSNLKINLKNNKNLNYNFFYPQTIFVNEKNKNFEDMEPNNLNNISKFLISFIKNL